MSWLPQVSLSDVRKQLKKIPAVRRAYGDFDLLRKYHQWRPTRAPIQGTSFFLYADPLEERGRALLRCRCSGQPHTKRVWHRAIDQLQPRLVLDVGVNYGEFLFARTYHEGTRVVGVEANPHLQSWLKRSLAEHPSRAQIELHAVMADDTAHDKAAFFVDPNWSGRSSAIADSRCTERVSVPTVRIDDLCHLEPGENLVFKVDVEGFEAKVLRGMSTLLASASQVVGLVEFAGTRIQSSGEDPFAMLDALLANYHVIAVAPDGATRQVTDKHSLGLSTHYDLVVATSARLADAVLGP